MLPKASSCAFSRPSPQVKGVHRDEKRRWFGSPKPGECCRCAGGGGGAGGVLGIPIVGRLMDSCGFVATASVTVTLAVAFGAGILFSGAAQLITAFV
jgi:hypothetical protein